MKNYFFYIKPSCLLAFVVLFSCSKEKDPVENTYSENYMFEEPAITGNTFYIDPEKGSSQGDGSQQNPWRTLQEVFEDNLVQHYKHSENYNPESELVLVNEDAPVKGGDRLILKSGYHGYLNLNNLMLKEWLTIEAAEGETPILSQIKFFGAFRNVHIKELAVIKSAYQGSENYWEAEAVTRNSNACIYLASSNFWGKGSHVKLNGLTLKSTTGVVDWTAADWVEKAAGGVGLRSVEYVEVVDCNIENVRHGITVDYNSDNSNIVNNTVTNFCGDGSRVISNNILFAYNTIQGCLKVDDNHDDGIQSYSRGEDGKAGTGTVSNVTIRGNLIISIIDKNNPLAGSMQGIGCFDGMFDNWTVENNVIISNTYHGISFYGLTNSRVVNNTVIDQVKDDNVSPWIMVRAHKNGTESQNCVVANNIASSSISSGGDGVYDYTNYVIGKTNYDSVYFMFIDPDNFDLHLQDNEQTRQHLIDKGTVFLDLVSSDADRDKKLRDDTPDLGAYELVR